MQVLQIIFNFLVISLAGLFIAFSPMLIITDLLIVLRSKKPILHAAVLLASIITPLLIIAFIASLLVKPDTQVSLSAINEKINVPPLLSVLIGAILVAYGLSRFIQLRYRPLRPKSIEDVRPEKAPPSKLLPLFTFGFMKTLFSVTNVFAILFVTKLIVTNHLGPMLAFFVIFWTVLVGLVPFLVIFYYQKNKRDYLLRVQALLNQRMSENVKAYVFVGIAVVGCLLTIASIRQVLG